MNASILTSETTEPLIALANAKMLSLASAIVDEEGALDEELIEKLSNVSVAATVVEETNQADDEDEDEEEEKEEEAEEEAAAGLGALFG